MKYRLTCLSPLLVGDGRKLSPIDYMVWKDQVSVLDQRRIFRLLAKGPRLDGYLAQLKRADKLDFASWGGFAQNYADRRIPFENPACSTYWNRAAGDSLQIPTFAAGASGPYLPGAAIKGALRTAMVAANWREGMLREVAGRFQGERPPRHPAEQVEEQVVGPAGTTRMRLVAAGRFGNGPGGAFPRLSAARFHAGAAPRRLRTGLETEPARCGGRHAARREHAMVCRDGGAGLGVRRRVARARVLFAARSAARRAMAGGFRAAGACSTRPTSTRRDCWGYRSSTRAGRRWSC